ncbi:hypothetical protein KKC1_31550 [Calderihabitans maritimus]|uniref:Uncharacterized protein n=1 Tax=Calderihabitans maritimus TaxID=1246530 RepID=A0A1Z5HWY0_9FIRM|nr:hypothetical protein KKC1_31550 [Calderihabitans maritimus]
MVHTSNFATQVDSTVHLLNVHLLNSIPMNGRPVKIRMHISELKKISFPGFKVLQLLYVQQVLNFGG